MERANSSRFWIPVVLLFLALSVQCVHAAWTNGQTIDESYYNGSGYPMVRYNNYEFLGEHPPLIIQLGALPLLLAQPHFPIHDFVRLPGSASVDISRTGVRFLYEMGNDPQDILFLERLSIVFLTILLGLAIFLFSRELCGKWGGALALSLFAFDPNILAHGSLYTTDMGLAVFYFFSIYALKRFFDSPSESRVFWLGMACGATLMSKISGLMLMPVITCLFLIFYFSRTQDIRIQKPSQTFEKWVLGTALFLIANAIGEKQAMVMFGPFLVLVAYFCARDIEKIRNSKLFSLALKGLALGGAVLCLVYSVRLKKKYGISAAVILTIGNLIAVSVAVLFARLSSDDVRMRILKYFLATWVFAALVIVLGYTDIAYKFCRFIGFGNYMKPLGIVLNHSKGGHGVCMEGSFVSCDWRYFPAVIAVKTPLVTLILAIVGFFSLIFARKALPVKALIFVPLVFFLGAAMANKINIGLRHILPVYPFIFLLAAYAGSLIGKIKPAALRISAAVVLCGFVALSAARTVAAGPDHLAYFNELVGGPEQGAKLVADSNLNWGQDNKRLAEFVVENKIPSIKISSEAMNADIYDYYKLLWKDFGPNDIIDPTPGFYALGIGYYMQLNNGARGTKKSWFYGKKPLYRVGKTFYVFQVPGNQTTADRP